MTTTANESLDRHEAYHVNGMMEPGCQPCLELIRRAPDEVSFRDHYTLTYLSTFDTKPKKHFPSAKAQAMDEALDAAHEVAQR